MNKYVIQKLTRISIPLQYFSKYIISWKYILQNSSNELHDIRYRWSWNPPFKTLVLCCLLRRRSITQTLLHQPWTHIRSPTHISMIDGPTLWWRYWLDNPIRHTTLSLVLYQTWLGFITYTTQPSWNLVDTMNW